ncbi:hypothetical protein BIY23_04650 [Wolbachia pipientis]|uniref:Uncharacterized protein n=1 Tax=Wolbachia pipientis TaxID=955 RepID=A0A1E7QK34_WOLPI|nr:hypothetical protein [Wolbachia pipientis]OEY86840.1 hypothetical protein BIY23_04650 [Wolbachia pipientis]
MIIERTMLFWEPYRKTPDEINKIRKLISQRCSITTEKALVRAYNVNNLYLNIKHSNFLATGKHIINTFNSDMTIEESGAYLNSIGVTTTERFSKLYENNDSLAQSFNLKYFPFNCGKTDIRKNTESRKLESKILLRPEVTSNLEGHLAHSMIEVILLDEGKDKGEFIGKLVSYKDTEKYIACIKFDSDDSKKKFLEDFLYEVWKIIARYDKEFPEDKKFSEDEMIVRLRDKVILIDNMKVYIKKDIFSNVHFIESYTLRTANAIGLNIIDRNNFDCPDEEKEYILYLQNIFESWLTEYVNQNAKINISLYKNVQYSFTPKFKIDRRFDILVPMIQTADGSLRYLSLDEANIINSTFDGLHALNAIQVGSSNLKTSSTCLDLHRIHGVDFNNNDSIYAIDFNIEELAFFFIVIQFIERSHMKCVGKKHELTFGSKNSISPPSLASQLNDSGFSEVSEERDLTQQSTPSTSMQNTKKTASTQSTNRSSRQCNLL